MTRYRYFQGGTEIFPADTITTGEGDDAVNHPGRDLLLWDEAQLAAYGIERQEVEEPPIPPEPRRVSKIDFRRLLTPLEAARYRLLEAAPRITGEELVAAFDPETPPGDAVELQVRIAVEDGIQQFNLLPEHIELDHADTAEFLAIMGLAGMFGADPAPRVAQIIAGDSPA